MKLLFDQNLSPSLVSRLADLFPNSAHLQQVNLGRAADSEIWDLALKRDYLIVSKDEDFDDMGVVRGTPPKVVWIQLGNCSTDEIEAIIRDHYLEIEMFNNDPMSGTLVLG